MRRLLASLMVMALATPSFAQVAQITANPKSITGSPQAPQFIVPVNLDGTIAGGSGAAASNVQGNVASGAADSGNPVKIGGVYNTTLPVVTNGQRVDIQASSQGALYAQMIGASQTAGDAQTNSFAWVGAAGITVPRLLAIGNYYFNGATWDRTRGDTVGAYVVGTPTPAAANAIAPAVTGGVAGSLVLKASAGNLYSWRVTSGASAGYVLVFNATSAPADGAVKPADCVAVAANSTVDHVATIPERYSTGITLVFSTTGCFVKTLSATAYIRGTVQ